MSEKIDWKMTRGKYVKKLKWNPEALPLMNGGLKSGVPVLTPTNIKFHLNMEYTIFFFKIPGVFIRFFFVTGREIKNET